MCQDVFEFRVKPPFNFAAGIKSLVLDVKNSRQRNGLEFGQVYLVYYGRSHTK